MYAKRKFQLRKCETIDIPPILLKVNLQRKQCTSVNEIKPTLKVITLTQHSISLRWTIDPEPETGKLSYKVEVDDPVVQWIVKYWGISNEATINDLAPEQVYMVRLGVLNENGDEVGSECIKTATKLGPPWMHHMYQAIERGNSKKLQTFLATRNKAIEAVNRFGETPLIQAARLGDITSTNILLNSNANPNSKMFPSQQTPLMSACFGGFTAVAKRLVQAGAKWTETDICGRDGLHYAVMNSQLETVKLAIEAGCEVNSRDNSSWTPLMKAVILGANSEVLNELLKHGADIQLRDNYNQTCLDMANLYKNEDILMLVTRRDEEEILQDLNEEKF